MSTHVKIASTILEQLGGNRFIAMTGARDFLAHENGALSFRIPRAKDGINNVKITLTADDLYDVEYIRSHKSDRGKLYSVISEYTGLFWEDLEQSFSRATGLVTHL